MEMAQFLVRQKSRPVHQRSGPGPGDRFRIRCWSLWNTSPGERAHEHEVGRGRKRARRRRVRSHDQVTRLVRAEAADVDEPAAGRRQAHPRRDRGDRRRATRSECRPLPALRVRRACGCARRGASADLVGREVRHGQDQPALPECERHFRAPEQARLPRRQRQLGIALGDRVVHGDTAGSCEAAAENTCRSKARRRRRAAPARPRASGAACR